MIDSSSSFVPRENWKGSKQNHLEASSFEMKHRHESEKLANANNPKNATGVKFTKSNERCDNINFQTESSDAIGNNIDSKPLQADASLIYHKIKHYNEKIDKFLTQNENSNDISIDVIEEQEQNEENTNIDEFEASLHNNGKVHEMCVQSLTENTINRNSKSLIFVENPSTGRFYTHNEHDINQFSLGDGYNKENDELGNGDQNVTPREKLIFRIKRLTYFGNLFSQGILAGCSIPPLLEILSHHTDCFGENCGQFDTTPSLSSRSTFTNRFFYLLLNICLLGVLSPPTSQNIDFMESTNDISNKGNGFYKGFKRLILILLFTSSLLLTMVLQLCEILAEHDTENFLSNGKGNILMGIIRSIFCIFAWMITCQSLFSE